MLSSPVQIAPFKEHPIINYTASEPYEFDIIAFGPDHAPDFIISGKFSLQQYCTCLLHRLFLLDKSDIKPFIQYQYEQLAEPLIWLNKFEKLIDLNRGLYTTQERIMKMEKALVVIELFRQDIQTHKISPASRFNFDKLKLKVKNYPTIEEKLLCLAEAKTEYLQNKPAQAPTGEVPFDEKVQLEIDLLKTQSKLSKKRQQTFTDQSTKSPPGPLKKHALSKIEGAPAKPKFQINSNLNVFVDIFYQLMHEKKINGKPYLDASPNELCEMIAAYFKDKEGRDISIDTIKTILKPSRFEKRPKGNTRFDIPD
jgi:hypothetical protein